MSDIDIYDVENLTTSDEYSDDDDMMNTAIGAPTMSQSTLNKSLSSTSSMSPPKKQKKKMRSIKERNLSYRLKKKSIKWLNNKELRGKYKSYMTLKPPSISLHSENKKPSKTESFLQIKEAVSLSGVINLESDCESSINQPIDRSNQPIPIEQDDDDDYSVLGIMWEDGDEEGEGEKPLHCMDSQRSPTSTMEPETPARSSVATSSTPKIAAMPTPAAISTGASTSAAMAAAKNTSAPTSAAADVPMSTSTDAATPTTLPVASSTAEINDTLVDTTEKPKLSLYGEINSLFKKFDKVVVENEKKLSTTEMIDDKVARLLLDIQAITDLLQGKEDEWNRLVNLKRVKEELIERLERKKYIIHLKEKQSYNKCSLLEMQELELYFSEPRSSTSNTNYKLSSFEDLVESRANMTSDDLKKERENTNRIQNLLLSNNILKGSGISNSDEKTHTFSKYQKQTDSDQEYKTMNFEQKPRSNLGRQGPFKDVKSLIEDFRQNHPDVMPRVGKRIRSNEDRMLDSIPSVSQNAKRLLLENSVNGTGCNYTPTLEKLLSTTGRNDSNINNYNLTTGDSYTSGYNPNHDVQKSYYRLTEDTHSNEISITPISVHYSQKAPISKMELPRTSLSTKSQRNVHYEMSGQRNFLHENLLLKEPCQQCKRDEARYVCAGCSNQWYCSRKCQIIAWDKHSEVCDG